MTRAYSPRLSTVHLIADINALPGIDKVTIIPGYGKRPTRLRITTNGMDGWGRPIYSDFTLAEARKWLAGEIASASN